MENSARNKNILEIIDQNTERIENIVMSAGLLIISAIVFTNVIARYFFHTSFNWSEELARYIVVWVTFFGISSCARYDTHVNVDLVPNLLKGSAKLIHQVVIRLISFGISIYMVYISTGFTKLQFSSGNKSVAVAVPIWLIYLATCIGFTLMSYVYLRKLMKLFADRKAEKEGV
ncbi:MAG TPA: TRAP transporter small permease [Clostridia bacterium]|nr:TRAP transporter small permease [Clostridia bacterium]